MISKTNLAVVYARFSSNNQRKESIDAQLRACKDYASKNGYIIVNTYCDSAKSGTSADREAFQQMIIDSDNSTFNFVIVHKLDRFSRDKYDSVHYKKKLRNNGIRVISTLEYLTDDTESIMLESVLEGMSQYYSANLSREVMKGLKENAYNCKHTGGIAPLGYNIDKHTLKYVINVKEAKVVSEIFNMYINGYGYSEMLNILNNKGYKTKLDNKFSKSSINSIIKNEKYRGIYLYNRKKELDFNRKRKPKEKPLDEIIRVENGIPRIISDDIFYKANHQLTKNRLRSGSYNAKRSYLLSGLINCNICGNSVTGNSRTGGKTTSMYSSYLCSAKTNKKAKTCNCKEIRKEYIENYILDEIIKLVSDKNKLINLIDTNVNQKSLINNDLTKCNKELNDVENEISNILKLVTDGLVSFDTIKTTLETLEENKSLLLTEIAELQEETYIQHLTIDSIEKLIESTKEALMSKDIDKCKKFIDRYINKVKVDNDTIVVILKITTIDKVSRKITNLSATITRDELYKRYKYLITNKK